MVSGPHVPKSTFYVRKWYDRNGLVPNWSYPFYAELNYDLCMAWSVNVAQSLLPGAEVSFFGPK